MNGTLLVEAAVFEDLSEDAPQELVSRWLYLEDSASRGVRAGVFEWLAGCPVRFSIGGTAGNCWLLLTLEPASWRTWRPVTSYRRSAQFASMPAVDGRKSPLDSRKQPSVGGKMAIHSSSGGAPSAVPDSWSPRTIAELRAEPSYSAPVMGGGYGHIIVRGRSVPIWIGPRCLCAPPLPPCLLCGFCGAARCCLVFRKYQSAARDFGQDRGSESYDSDTPLLIASLRPRAPLHIKSCAARTSVRHRPVG